jgi:hypothetical protein
MDFSKREVRSRWLGRVCHRSGRKASCLISQPSQPSRPTQAPPRGAPALFHCGRAAPQQRQLRPARLAPCGACMHCSWLAATPCPSNPGTHPPPPRQPPPVPPRPPPTQVRDTASDVPSTYTPPDFFSRALQHTDPTLTWDETDRGRKRVGARRNEGGGGLGRSRAYRRASRIAGRPAPADRRRPSITGAVCMRALLGSRSRRWPHARARTCAPGLSSRARPPPPPLPEPSGETGLEPQAE